MKRQWLNLQYFSGTCNPNFVDSDGDDCHRYAIYKWCLPTGGYGPGWTWTETFEDYATNGQTAAVCPQCGCGQGNIFRVPK